MYKNTVFVAAVALILCWTNPASGAVVYRNVGELTAQAQQIVIGDVVDITSFWTADGLIRSQITVSVSDYLLGSGSGTEVLEMSGGTIDKVSLHVSVLPVFYVGDHVLLFLGDSDIRLVEAFQGAYLTDGKLIARTAPACGRVIDASVEPLPDFLAEIGRALPQGIVRLHSAPYDGDFRLPLGGSRFGLCGYDWTYQSDPMGETYKINANCQDNGAGDAASQRAAIQNGPAAWNNAGADFVFTYGGTSTQTSVSNNGTNLVYFDNTPPDGGGYVAATYIWFSGSNISECDLVFNDRDYGWWNGSGGCLNMMDIWNVATHEFGHWLCLEDLYNSSDADKTMYGYVDYCDIHARTLAQDDINGIIAIYGSGGPADTTPPTPDPMTFATAPAPDSTNSVYMVATTATDSQSPPVQYQFDFVSGGAGGTDSGWVSGTIYTDSGLTANTAYTYRVNARDSASPPNETSFSSNAATATWIETPSSVAFGTVTLGSIVLNATGSFTNLTTGSSGVYFDSTTTGGDGGINQWIQVATDTATGLNPNTTYNFQAKARNQNALETPYCTATGTATLIETPTGVAFGTLTTNSMVLNATGTLTNLSSGSSGVYFDSTTTGGDGGINQWVQVATDTATGLVANSAYTFQVKARNQGAVETAYCPPSTNATLIETPAGLAAGTLSTSSIVLNATGTLTNLTTGSSGLYFDSTTPGGDGGLNQWIQVTTDTATSLGANTAYTFQAKARNQNAVETAYCSPLITATLIETPTGLSFGTLGTSSIVLNATGTLSNLTTGSSGLYFDSTTPGGDGGINQWVQVTTDTATGLVANTAYSFEVKARNQNAVETAYTSPAATATLIETPAGISFGPLTTNSIALNATGTLTNLSTGSSGVYFDSTTTGGDGGINEWIQATADTATSLAANTAYTFQAKARNQNGVETAFCSPATTASLIETPAGISFGTVTSSSVVLNATGTFSNLTISSSGLYFGSTTPGGDGGINQWVQVTTDTATGLAPNTTYAFQVKARNQDSVETPYSATSNKTTLADVPAAPTLSNPTSSSLVLDVNAAGNPANTEFAIQCTATSDANWNGKFVDATGQPSATEIWRTDSAWGTITIPNLLPRTAYTFAVKARNLEGVPTALGPGATLSTIGRVGDVNGDGNVDNFDITPFVYALTHTQAELEAAYPGGCYWCGDVNGDGNVDNFDISPFVALLAGG